MSLRKSGLSRWTLLGVAAAAMGVAGTYQFVWSSVRIPLGARLSVPEAGLGTVFTVFVVFQTVSQFPAGWIRDRYGPQIPMLAGAVLLAAGYALVGTAGSLPAAYLGYGVGGVGAGIAYTVALNTGVKWFDDRRGLATGVVNMAYGGLSFLLIPAVRGQITGAFESTVLAVGALAGVVALVAALVLRDPGSDSNAAPAGSRAAGESEAPVAETDGSGGVGWRGAVRSWQFWVLYLAFVVVNGVGLMVIGKVVAYARELGLSSATATMGASVVAVSSATGVTVVGAVSDRVGRERTSVATLVVSGLALLGTVAVGDVGIGLGFVALVGIFEFFRSPAYAVFPSLVGDYFGRARSSENYALLYTAKLWGGVIGGTVASQMVITLGWSTSFLVGGVGMLVAGLSLVVLRAP